MLQVTPPLGGTTKNKDMHVANTNPLYHFLSIAAIRIFFRLITKKFKLPQYFSWYHCLKKNEIINYFY